MIKAPWTPEQVDALNRYQEEGRFHPFTCGTKEKHPQIEHPSGWIETVGEKLVATENGWECTVCDYRQDWAHEFMAETV